MKIALKYFLLLVCMTMLADIAFCQTAAIRGQVHDEDGMEHNEGKGAIEYWGNLEKMIKEKNRENGLGNIDRIKARFNEFNKQNDKFQRGELSLSGAWSQVYQSQSAVGMGRIEDVAFSPTDANTIYVATSGGGVWKTTNGGTSYFPLTDGLPTGGVNSIVVDQNNANNVYMFAGSGFGANYYPGTIYKSINAGFSWKQTGFANMPVPIYGYELKMHPTNSNILYAATNNGLYRTIDAGASWNIVLVADYNQIFDIEFKPNDPSIVYAVGFNRFFYSFSNGDTATWLSRQIPAVPSQVYSNAATRIAVSAAAPNSVYFAKAVYSATDSVEAADGAVFYNDVTINGVSPGYTITWGTAKKVKACNVVCNRSGGGRSYGDIYVSQTNALNVVISGLETFASSNGGTTWILKNRVCGVSGENFHVDVGKLRGKNGKFYFTMDGGIYTQTEDYLSSSSAWTDITGSIEITQLYTHAASPQDAERYMYANQDNGVHVRTSASSYYNYVGGDGTMCRINKTNKEIYYGSIQNGEYMYRHNTDGTNTYVTPRTFNTSSINVLDSGEYKGTFNFSKCFELNENNTTDVYCVKRSLYKSTNRGDSWTGYTITGTSNTHYLLRVGKSNINRMYVIEDGTGKFQRTDDGGTVWTDITPNKRFNGVISDLAINPSNSLDIYITYYGNTDTSKVYRSVNGGVSWTNLSQGLPNIDTRCVTLIGNSINSIYIGNDYGVFYRDDNLGKWINFSNNLPVTFVMNMEYDATNSKISAATYGRGIWISDLYTAASCIADRALNSTYYYRNVYTASNDITTTGTVYGEANTNIKFSAGHHVIMQPGFVAQEHSNFIASAEGCAPAATPIRINPDSTRPVDSTNNRLVYPKILMPKPDADIPAVKKKDSGEGKKEE